MLHRREQQHSYAQGILPHVMRQLPTDGGTYLPSRDSTSGATIVNGASALDEGLYPFDNCSNIVIKVNECVLLFGSPSEFSVSFRNGETKDVFLYETEIQLLALENLEKGWDGRNASPIRKGIFEYTRWLLNECGKITSFVPNIVPLPSSGIQLEWFINEHEIEVEIEQENLAVVMYENTNNGKDETIHISNESDIAKIKAILQKL